MFINDDESGLHRDYDAWLEKIAPHEPVSKYRHNDTGEDNADAPSSGKAWGARSSSLSLRDGWTLGRGSRYFMGGSTEGGESECW